jgi:hypothetical protein
LQQRQYILGRLHLRNHARGHEPVINLVGWNTHWATSAKQTTKKYLTPKHLSQLISVMLLVMKKSVVVIILLGLIFFGVTSTFTYGNSDDFSSRGWPISYKKIALDDTNRLCAAPNYELSIQRLDPPSCFGDQPLNKANLAGDLLVYLAVATVLYLGYKNLRKNT